MRQRNLVVILLATVAMATSAVLIAARPSRAPIPRRPDMPWQLCPDVVVAAPDATRLAWRDCGEGCRELATDGMHRFFGAIGGTAKDGTHWLSVVHDRDTSHELAVYRLPSDTAAFAARMTKGFTGCLLRARAVGAAGVLVEASLRDGDGRRRRLVSEQPDGGLVGDDDSSRPPLETVVAGGMRVQTTTRTSLEVDGKPAWHAPPNVLISDLAIRGTTVAFTAVNGKQSELQEWDGNAVHVLATDAGGPITDGTDLVWFANDHGAPALFTARTGTPRRLRTAYQDYVDGSRGVVGEGFALHVERRRAETEGTLILTRLADGMSWVIPPRAGTRWGTPLWIDRDELAIVLDPVAATTRAGTIAYGESATIVRLANPAIGAARTHATRDELARAQLGDQVGGGGAVE